MGLVTSRTSVSLVRRLSSLSFRRKIISCCICVIFLSIFLAIHVQYLLSPTFIPFANVSSFLVPSALLTDVSQPICAHTYEKLLSDEKLLLLVNVSDSDLNDLPEISNGGHWSPRDCVSKYRVNLVVPYRNRRRHLNDFLHYIHRFLKLQEIDYRIFVVEQSEEKQFNRGKLFNIGFVEAQKHHPAECYIFHDVDLIPLDLNNIYACTRMPRHLSAAVDVFNYELPYRTIFGGAVAISRQQFELINGYSNSFYGWGGEDDDFYSRVIRAGLDVARFELAISRYHMLDHAKETPNPDRFLTMKMSKHRQGIDGLSNVNYLNYSLLSYELTRHFTRVLVAL